MSRARATALALVNWKGVFYERYQLDRRVTALEGANGAGKTTVMIAAYIVLLPDMSRLRFTNLGETAATGGDRGIWGRLGEATRPSYAALELELGEGQRVIAGVMLTRKAEPTVELTPFLISQLEPGIRLQDLLLLTTADEEAIPELPELKSNVAAARARIEVFASGKEYFAALFELGIGALRLATDEDRGRLGDMLRTSMTGGISRAITAELRSFLLREQVSISDTLARMRENLNACRRTRIEVSEAQLLEQEISGIYDAGRGMFAAALQAAREQAREQRAACARLQEQEQLARKSVAGAVQASRELEEREAELTAQLEEQRRQLEQLREQTRAFGSFESLSAILRDVEQERASALEQVAQARSLQQAATARREAEKQKREAAQQAQERAALGLADLQAGLDELHRRSSRYRNAQRLLTEAALEPAGLAAAHVEERLATLEQRLTELDLEQVSHERALGLAARHAQEWQSALGLARELGIDVEPTLAYEAAKAALRTLDALEQGQAELSGSVERRRELERLHERQRTARKTAQGLGLQVLPGAALEELERASIEAEAVQEHASEEKAQLDEERRQLEARHTALREQLKQTQASLGRYRRLEQRMQQITECAGPFAPTREAVLRLRSSLAEERQELGFALEAATARREALLREANQLEASGGQFSQELMLVRDELDGELLGNRFEELDVKQAARLEALLGPLTQAIVVDDVAAALERLRDKPRELAELRLIAAGTDLEALERTATEGSRDVCVNEGPAVRVTRRPERPSLGRKAREQRVFDLREQAAGMSQELEQKQNRLRGVTAALTELDQLLPDAELMERGDPGVALNELEGRDAEHNAERRELEQRIHEAEERAKAAKKQVGRLRALLPEAFVLDAPDYAPELEARREQIARLEQAGTELARLQTPRSKLTRELEALRTPPKTDAELAELEARRAELGLERDQAFRARQTLRELLPELPALGYGDAELSLANQKQVAPALEEQHQQARAEVENAERQVLAAEAAWEEATLALQQKEAAQAAVSAHAERLSAELSGLGLPAGLTPERAAEQLAELAARADSLALEERDLLAQRGAQAERVRQAGLELGRVERELAVATAAATPAQERWQELRGMAERARVLHSGESSDDDAERSALELQAEARSRAALLTDRLSAARGGEALAEELAPQTEDASEAFLEIWLKVREWLARRVPVQVAQVDDPLLALERLRGHLSVLEQRLAHQEADLRGASEDVARGIEVQLRRAKAQVRRLNQNLEGVSFGSIAGIRVEMRRQQQMEPVLRALSEGSAQELLFQSSLPTEEALTELLRRYGGGRSGGGRVLDYREYLELAVEVQRKADGSWEAANPTRLSTGEAIGVGAALMMVILAEWERDANLLRARRGPGSLRFLFLDEANRLSQDNLGSLFDLCESLDLQLLIAAPEVARADGNTTYRLVRKVTEDGREEVIVSGRRALGAEAAAATAAPAAPAPAVQTSLFEN